VLQYVLRSWVELLFRGDVPQHISDQEREDDMAIITCSECGREISDQANTCVQCGFPLDMRISADYVESRENPEPENKNHNIDVPLTQLIVDAVNSFGQKTLGGLWRKVYVYGVIAAALLLVFVGVFFLGTWMLRQSELDYQRSAHAILIKMKAEMNKFYWKEQSIHEIPVYSVQTAEMIGEPSILLEVGDAIKQLQPTGRWLQRHEKLTSLYSVFFEYGYAVIYTPEITESYRSAQSERDRRFKALLQQLLKEIPDPDAK
jgi:hypothetical protein